MNKRLKLLIDATIEESAGDRAVVKAVEDCLSNIKYNDTEITNLKNSIKSRRKTKKDYVTQLDKIRAGKFQVKKDGPERYVEYL